MANPSSSHHDRDDRDRHRRERSHHHRTISSTTLLLVLSLILAVLAVMLSLPSSATTPSGDPAGTGVWGILAPKRSQALVARESSVAMREADVARREAELLAGAPGGVLPTPIVCPVCEPPAVQTVIKEVVKEQELTPPGWWKEAGSRAEDILDRELKIAERERDIGKREENVNRREHDASRRESWIMEQLVALGNENPQSFEEEYLYEPTGSKRKAKGLPPLIVDYEYEPETKTITLPAETVTVPQPASTRPAAFPTPEPVSPSTSTGIPRTTAVEVVVEEASPPSLPNFKRRPPARWFGRW